jgi:hypothetical protein
MRLMTVSSSIPPPQGEGGRPQADRVGDTGGIGFVVIGLIGQVYTPNPTRPPGKGRRGRPPLAGEGWSKPHRLADAAAPGPR